MSKLRTVSQNIRVIARYLDDDKWEETKDLMEKQPSFRRGLAHFYDVMLMMLKNLIWPRSGKNARCCG